jgi:hypothetical protein
LTYAYGDCVIGVKIIAWNKFLTLPKSVVGGAREGARECEAVRREWLWESIRARERRKERNVRGAMSNYIARIISNLFV